MDRFYVEFAIIVFCIAAVSFLVGLLLASGRIEDLTDELKETKHERDGLFRIVSYTQETKQKRDSKGRFVKGAE